MTTILYFNNRKDQKSQPFPYDQQHSLPSPPDSTSYSSSSDGDDYTTISDNNQIERHRHVEKLSIFNLKELPTMNLPENYTIDHSIIQQKQQNNKGSRVTWSEKKKQKMNDNSESTVVQKKRKRSHSASSTASFTAEVSSTASTEIVNIEEAEEVVDVVEDEGDGNEHRCRDCGKVYKHLNCLFKHQWEHTEQWEYTSSFLLTKHQQVQMLEAASILLNMKNRKHQQHKPLLTNKKRKRNAVHPLKV
ncbi:hypothetical protein BDF20DRAFT_834363 [Mycotypha africana]|uniref:uncharacterized protein n=1 Tax=Mycotypha africana TaxID=64632 RepID=UPI00230038D6|nr:uncharacterized protein BDF20DRAFT_834363 [Mycotypha africana]KAI8981672.1 hypothetical protein BDF20DRAFT_834363 [Mycotypha africana]